VLPEGPTSHVVVRSAPVIEDVHVSTEIEMTVKRLLLTVFSYRHRSEERWRDGRLMALKSETTEGGERFSVDGALVAKGFRVVGKKGPFIAPPAALTSNCLWNAAILEQDAVIDAQHGGVIGLSVRRLHPALSTLKVNDLVPSGVVTPIHPGALKYYREAGLSR
jgi:hypothetical protein